MLLAYLVILFEFYALVDNSGLLKGKYNTGFLGWFTNLSNIFVFVYFICIALKINVSSFITLTVVLSITMTFLIYHFMLFPDQYNEYKRGGNRWLFTFTNLAFHYFCPLMTIIYWIIYGNKSGLGYIDGIKWLIVPLVYVIYILIRAKLNIKIANDGEVYPYPFMNLRELGLKNFIINIIGLCIGFGILGELVVFLVKMIGG